MIWWRKARQGISVQTSILIVSHSVSQRVTEIWIQDCPCPPVCTSHSFSLAMKSRHSACKYWKAPEECMQRTFLHPFLVTLEDEAIKCLRRLSLGLLGFPQAKRLLKKWISVTDISYFKKSQIWLRSYFLNSHIFLLHAELLRDGNNAAFMVNVIHVKSKHTRVWFVLMKYIWWVVYFNLQRINHSAFTGVCIMNNDFTFLLLLLLLNWEFLDCAFLQVLNVGSPFFNCMSFH